MVINSKSFFPLIMSLLSMFYNLSIAFDNLSSINSGYIEWKGIVISFFVFGIPFIGFLIISIFCILNKFNILFSIILTVVWTIVCLPLTWFIATTIDRYIYLGVELYL